MEELGKVEDTLFVPMIGRIYASKYHKNILFDEKALDLEDKLPKRVLDNDHQKQYTLIASASRSANMDRYVRNFLKDNPDGAIVELGCGLETTYYRNLDLDPIWYGIDLSNVIEYRKKLLPQKGKLHYLSNSVFDDGWLEEIIESNPNRKILMLSSGLFYYFKEEEVLSLLRKIASAPAHIEIVFDSVNKTGMKMMQKKYMKEVGHKDASVYFYVDKGEELIEKMGNNVKLLQEEPYYRYIERKGLKLSTRLSMGISDMTKMVKMIHLKLC